VRREHHVASAFQHPELRLEGARRAAEVGVGDDVEDRFAWSGDPDRERPERPDGTTEVEVDGELAAGEKRRDSVEAGAG
jgi:hypothetical protein